MDVILETTDIVIEYKTNLNHLGYGDLNLIEGIIRSLDIEFSIRNSGMIENNYFISELIKLILIDSRYDIPLMDEECEKQMVYYTFIFCRKWYQLYKNYLYEEIQLPLKDGKIIYNGPDEGYDEVKCYYSRYRFDRLYYYDMIYSRYY